MKTTEEYLDEYISMMEVALARPTPDGYTEKHHILPKSWMPNDYLVVLTAQEHFTAHYLLHKAFPEDDKMAQAFGMMCWVRTDAQERIEVSADMYAEGRIAYSRSRASKDVFDFLHPEHGHRNCTAFDLRLEFPELVRKQTGRLTSGERNITKGWQLGVPGDAFFRHRAGKNNPMFGRKSKRVTCEHCGNTDIAVGIYGRWHKDGKCKTE